MTLERCKLHDPGQEFLKFGSTAVYCDSYQDADGQRIVSLHLVRSDEAQLSEVNNHSAYTSNGNNMSMQTQFPCKQCLAAIQRIVLVSEEVVQNVRIVSQGIAKVVEIERSTEAPLVKIFEAVDVMI